MRMDFPDDSMEILSDFQTSATREREYLFFIDSRAHLLPVRLEQQLQMIKICFPFLCKYFR